MDKHGRVAVIGNSLTMAGIAASLKADTTLKVVCASPDSPTAWDSLDENYLAAIVFDLTDPSIKLDVAVLRNWPSLLLIGVDPSKDEILVLSSRPAQMFGMADLVGMIHLQEITSSSFE